MSDPLPKWEMKKYAFLWKKFESKKFTNEQALKFLGEKDPHILSVLFYDLRKFEWVTMEKDKVDKRKKWYILKEPNKAVKEMGSKK